MGQNGVKAGGEVEEGIGYWLSVTWVISLSDEDATCTTDLLLWGETSTISVSWEEERKGWRENRGITIPWMDKAGGIASACTLSSCAAADPMVEFGLSGRRWISLATEQAVSERESLAAAVLFNSLSPQWQTMEEPPGPHSRAKTTDSLIYNHNPLKQHCHASLFPPW